MNKEVLLQAFDKYYNTVTKTGYIPSNMINDFIVATWILEIISGESGVLLTKEEYNLLSKLYTCIEGGCLVPYNNYCQEVTVNLVPVGTYVRITEDSENRFTEQDDLRTI